MPDVSIAISAKDSYSGVLLKLKNSMLATNKDAAGLEKQFGELTKELSGLQTELKAAERPLKNLQQEFKKTGDAATLDKMKEAQENYNNIKNNLDAVSKAAKQTQKDLDNLAKTDERKSNRAGGSSLASKIGQSGIISMIGNTAADAANTIVSSAFGSRTGEMFGSVLSGITSGAAMGTMLGGPVGTAVGAVVGGVTGVVQGAVNHFEKDDDEFKSVVESEFSRIDGIIKQSKESGSGIAAEREMTETSFRTLIGEEATNNLIPQLKTYADVTPFSYDTIMNSANQLLAFSVKPDKMMGLMKMFGDLSGGNADKLATIIRSYGKSFAAQRADSQDLGMMTEAGIPILSALAKIKKVSETKIRDVVSEGKVSAADVEKAIALLTTNGGMFEGMMEKMSQTYTGLLSTREGVEDDWDNAMGMGYNEERKKGHQAIIDFGSNGEDAIMKEIMGYVGSFQASVENAYDEKMIKTMKDLYGSEEVQKAKSEGNMEKLYQIFFDAYSKIQNEYVNSDEYKSLENAQLGAVDKLQESLAPRYQDYGYRMGLAFNEGLASTEYMQKNTAERFASFFSTPKTGTTILEQHGTSRNKGFAWGLSFVPYDNFPAILHEGERVMTASENRRYSSGNSNSAVITITGNNFSVRNDSDIDAIASALADKIEEAKEGYYDG